MGVLDEIKANSTQVVVEVEVRVELGNDTNDETRVPRKPCKKETKILDTIFKDYDHFHSVKTCAKSIVILLKSTQKGSPGPQIFVKFNILRFSES